MLFKLSLDQDAYIGTILFVSAIVVVGLGEWIVSMILSTG
jgi:hypothetical protein